MKKMRYLAYLPLLIILLCGCKNARTGDVKGEGDTLRMSHATNITMVRYPHYTVVTLKNPWKQDAILATYVLVERKDSAQASHLPNGIVLYTPLRRNIVFTTSHAYLMEMLGCRKTIVGVADAKYMLIPDIKKRLGKDITDVGNSMKPDFERIIDLRPDAVWLSPFDNGGSYGTLENTDIPVIACADYMETSALGRAEWMKFYALLLGSETRAQQLYTQMERNYNALSARASHAKRTLSVLPDKLVSNVWYVPGGKSSAGMLYHDAYGHYAYLNDGHSGSLALPFEQVLDKMGNADFWLICQNGPLNKRMLGSEYEGYAAMKPYKTGEIYYCRVDSVPYFEQQSWRPDLLLHDLVQLFHPDLKLGNLYFYKKLTH